MQRLLGTGIAAHILIGLIGLIGLTGASEAQVLQPFPFTYQGRTPWPGSLPSPGAFQRQVAADFTGDGLKDVFLLAGGAPLFFYAPDSWETVYRASNSDDSAYNDMALVPPEGSGLPQIAMVGAAGLERLIYFPPTVPPTNPDNGTLVAGLFARYSITSDPAWTNAKLVRTGYVDSGSELDYVGLGSNAHTIIVRRGTGTGVVQTTFNVVETVHEIALVQWNDTPELELALLDGYGVEIYSYSGSLIHRFARPTFGTEAFCVYRQNILVGGVQVADGRDRVAWARQRTTDPASQEIVELAGPDRIAVSNVIITDPDDPIVSMSAADLATDTQPADGNWELAVHHEHDCVPFIFKNLGPSMLLPAPPSFSNQGVPDTINSTWQKLDLDSLLGQSASTVPGSTTMAAPLCEDLNGDGRVDVHVAVPSGTASFFQCWRGASGAPGFGTIVGGDFIAGVRHLGASVPSGGDYGLEFQFDLGVVAWPSNADALEWTIWQRDIGTGGYAAYRHVYYTLPVSGVPTGMIYPVAPIEIPPSFTECPNEQYWYEIRFASVTPGGLVAQSTDYIDAIGPHPDELLPFKDPDYSTQVCVTNATGCSDPQPTTCVISGGRPITSPLSMTRRRMVPPSGGGTGYFPLPPDPQHLGEIPTQSHP